MSKERQKGSLFERQVAVYIANETGQDISRNPLMGKNDQGDLRGYTANGLKVTIECKNQKALRLSEWMDEAERERRNANADIAVVIHKRKGYGEKSFGDTYVTLTLDGFLKLGGRHA